MVGRINKILKDPSTFNDSCKKSNARSYNISPTCVNTIRKFANVSPPLLTFDMNEKNWIIGF